MSMGQEPRAAAQAAQAHIADLLDRLIELSSLERAEAVKRYLYEQHQVPLHKINTISYGESKPAGENRTRDGRAKNRRVEIEVVGTRTVR